MNLERHTGYLCDRQATQKDSFLIHAGPFPQSYFFAKTPYEVEFLRKISDQKTALLQQPFDRFAERNTSAIAVLKRNGKMTVGVQDFLLPDDPLTKQAAHNTANSKHSSYHIVFFLKALS